MNINIIEGGVTSPKGFLSSGIHAGIKKDKNKKDLTLLVSEKICNAAGVYTKNKVKGAPLLVTKDHLIDNKAQAVIINSGNANTCTGEKGLIAAETMCSLVANSLNYQTEDVLVASTGVIGVQLNVKPIEDSMTSLIDELSPEGSLSSAEAIMTTDTFSKSLSIKFELSGKEVTLGAMAKGSGMIHPNMATMLSFITTDANISSALLDKALKDTVNISYNRISVDGDSSTNDMVIILANGLAENTLIDSENEDYLVFVEALKTLNITLAKLIAKDGEGATKLIECTVSNVSSEEIGEKLSKSVISSSLVKAAIFGSDANWGRVLCALGYADVDVDLSNIDIFFESAKGTIKVCENAFPVDFSEEIAKKILLEKEIKILVDMKSGSHSVSCWGCDLTYDYVKINGDYRS
ncbi:bifunctional glutamate N-acetyltransferase/amino-acid acetyltransferase ArgJ [Clostridium intestinale]|uniref:bifunctional glutamate N-acetyltransferase/amino-acid acetyltransferase ArgJ n=1 Tax=Clostridium intestinale TaxID=36845 RepID=UPI0028E817F9|nr:bifunctional glutamate N-acetyltransferase/amino-acid acetyltransferase ArgJ [Clostridium intestinale]